MRMCCSDRLLLYKHKEFTEGYPISDGNRACTADRNSDSSDRFSRFGYEMKGDFFT